MSRCFVALLALLASCDQIPETASHAEELITHIAIPAGISALGCTTPALCRTVDAPLRYVSLPAYAIDPHEVTVRQYRRCVAAAACGELVAHLDDAGDLPVRDVRWQDAADYCEWAGGRLPSEAEWERAARIAHPDGPYPWGDELPACRLANYRGCADGLRPVCTHRHGRLCDIAGNVSEWTADIYGGGMVVVKGGDWGHDAYALVVWTRDIADPVLRYDGIGFRCVY